MSDTWPQYLRRISAGQTQTQIADRIGIGRLSVHNGLRGRTRPKAETVIAIAQAYQRSPLEALLAASYLEPGDLNGPVIHASLRDLSAHEITEEVGRRLSALEELESTAAPAEPEEEVSTPHQE